MRFNWLYIETIHFVLVLVHCNVITQSFTFTRSSKAFLKLLLFENSVN